MKKHMRYDGLILADEDYVTLGRVLEGAAVANYLTQGVMTYVDPEGNVYLIPATETLDGFRAKLADTEQNGIDAFARAYEAAMPFDPEVLY